MYSMGFDLGAKNLKVILLDWENQVVDRWLYPVKGQPLECLLSFISDVSHQEWFEQVDFIGTTGSGFSLAKTVLGANYSSDKEEIYQGIIELKYSEVKTIIDIGDQDATIISIEDGKIIGKGKPKDCQKGLGALMNRQSKEYGLSISQWDNLAKEAEQGERISAKCTLYMERDIVKKQQQYCPLEQIIKGTNQAVSRCFIQNIAKGVNVKQPILFAGGLAEYESIKLELQEGIGLTMDVVEYPLWFGAEAVALRAKMDGNKCEFRGRDILTNQYELERFPCDGCDNQCPIIGFHINQEVVFHWGGKCDKWSE